MKRKSWKQKSILALFAGVLMLALAFVVDVPGKTAYAEDATDVRVPDDAKGKVAEDAFDANIKVTQFCTHSSEKYEYYNITQATLTQSGHCDIDVYCADCGDYLGSQGYAIIYPASNIYVKKAANTYTGKAITPAVVVKSSDGNDLFKNEDYTLSYASGRKNVGSYTVTVKGKYRYKFTKKLTFTINPKGTEISKLSAGKKAFTAKLKKQSTQTTGYELFYSTSCKFSKAATKSKSITSYKTTTKKITGLKKGKTYYVKVRTYKTVKGKKYYSGWSKVKTVKVK